MRWLPVVILLLYLAGCGGRRPAYTTLEKEMQRTAGVTLSSSEVFAHSIAKPPPIPCPQSVPAPHMPGYNPRGETAPLRTVADVAANIASDWAALKQVLAAHPEDAKSRYDYPALLKIADRLVMRAGELERARRYELAASGTPPEQYKPEQIDRDIKLYTVNVRRLQLAAAHRQPHDVEAVLMNLPRAVPRFVKGAVGP